MDVSISESITKKQMDLINLETVIERIMMDESLKEKIQKCRDLPSKDQRRIYKTQNLPYFCLGEFRANVRKKENLSSIEALVIDIDGCEAGILEDLKRKLRNDSEVLFTFTSPSGNGLKVVVTFDRCVTDPDEYARIFKAYVTSFSLKYDIEVDTSGSDCSRACFFSHDPDLFYNQDNQPLNVDEMITRYHELNPREGGLASIKSSEASQVDEMISFLVEKNNETGEIYDKYQDWQILGLALASLGEEGRKHFQDLSIGNKHFDDAPEIIDAEFDKLLKCYGRNTGKAVTVSTIYYIARKFGYTDGRAVPHQYENSDCDDTPEFCIDENSGDDCSYCYDDIQVEGNQVTPDLTDFDETVPCYEPSYTDVLQEIALLHTEAEREKALKSLAKEQKVTLSSVKKDFHAHLSNYKQTNVVGNVHIVHPALHVQKEFLCVGFKYKVLVNNVPEDKPIFLFSGRKGGFYLTEEVAPRIGKMQIVIDLKNRLLPNIDNRWSKDSLTKFMEKNEPPTNVYNNLKSVLKSYIEFQKEEHYGLVAAWIISTYFHRCFNAIVYLFVFGKKGTAKSRLLQLLELLAFNAVKGTTSTHAAFIDTVDGMRGTFLTDQASALSDPKNAENIGFHADSYTIDGGKKRLVTQGSNGMRQVQEFEAYSPKGYASLTEIDEDLRDRCILIPMVRATKEYEYPAGYSPIWHDLRDSLYRLLLTRWTLALEIYPNTGMNLTQRPRELWRPLETVLRLENVGSEEIENLKRAFCLSIAETQDELSDRERVLIDALSLLTETKKDDPNGVSLSSMDIMLQMKKIATAMQLDLGFDNDKKYTTWIGKNIKRMSLASTRDPKKIAKRHCYIFHYNHIRDINSRFQTNTLI